MHFDDRLATVLRQPAGGAVAARIQYRQLLDLLGTMPVDLQNDATDKASLRLGELADEIAAPARAAILRDRGLRLRNPSLIALLAAGEPVVAAAALEAASLDDEQWLDLAPALPVAARSYLRLRRDLGANVEALLTRLGIFDRGLPPADSPASRSRRKAGAKPRGGAPDEESRPNGIGALVRRIDEFRKTRQPLEGDFVHADAPRLPLLDDHLGLQSGRPATTFDFSTDAQMRIEWCSHDMAPMAAGMSLLQTGLARTLLRHQPLRGVQIELAGAPAIAGPWQIDAAARFDPADGHFAGYCGRMRRPAPAPPAELTTASGDSDSDRIRQLLHELRTPVNAIQGFAEVIQQQLFGPTPHGYRALAASVASDAATMLAGFEELERLARLEGGSLELEAGACDFGEILETGVARLAPFNDARGSSFALTRGGPIPVALAQDYAELLAWRLLSALAGSANPGERTEIVAAASAGTVEVSLSLPAALAAIPEDEPISALAVGTHKALSPGSFGTGFALRLAAAEARAVGGLLERRGQAMVLALPGLTGQTSNHSDRARSH